MQIIRGSHSTVVTTLRNRRQIFKFLQGTKRMHRIIVRFEISGFTVDWQRISFRVVQSLRMLRDFNIVWCFQKSIRLMTMFFYLVSRWLAGVEESQKTDVHYRYSDVVRFSDRLRPSIIHVDTRLLSSSLLVLESAKLLRG